MPTAPLRRALTTQQKQLRLARQYKKMLPRLPRPHKAIVTKAKFMLALDGSAGIYSTIAQRLDVAWGTVARLLERPDWQDMRDKLLDEIKSANDLAETRLGELLKQDADPSVALSAVKYFLSHKRPKIYGEKVTVEGGDKPIATANMTIDVNALLGRLPIEVKRQLLEAQEQLEAAAKPV